MPPVRLYFAGTEDLLSGLWNTTDPASLEESWGMDPFDPDNLHSGQVPHTHSGWFRLGNAHETGTYTSPGPE
jgi:hypothetical protein